MGSIASEDEVTVEVRVASPAHYLLKIESFSLLLESGVEKFESNEFEAGGYKWKMIIYPDGKGSDKGSEHVSVYLALSGTSFLPAGWEVNAIYNFFLFNQLSDNYLSVRGKMRRFDPIKSLWGLPKFVSHKTFKEASNGYLVDDKCVFEAEIFVIQRQEISECLSMVKSNDSFKSEWKICNFSNLDQDWFSEKFTVGGYKWKLWLCKGSDISIFLKSVDAKDFDHCQKVKAKCSICLKDQINGECEKLSYWNWFSTTVKSWGYPAFMPLIEMHDQKKVIVSMIVLWWRLRWKLCLSIP
ncbi:uncharacterized protein LOC132618961 isoform X3 [Lycium barbarum]|uniref:uncharacterized protein LOC132618961 isoform X3 n=1 Tax=Lycium barbarum TaxID=112863 RepID=UPI00293E3C8D|nr:uncharacterized protein LOC132618961 isoform X3 [Lycium barbarum]